MSKIRLFLVAVIAVVALTAAATIFVPKMQGIPDVNEQKGIGNADGSQKKPSGDMTGHVSDDIWTFEIVHDAYTDSPGALVVGKTSIEDGHEGSLTTVVKYDDGADAISFEFEYLSDQADNPDACNRLSLLSNERGFVDIEARSEFSDDIQAVPETRKNCNAATVSIYFDDSDGGKQVFDASNFKIRIPLGNGMVSVVWMDFRNNRALKSFASYVMQKVAAAKNRNNGSTSPPKANGNDDAQQVASNSAQSSGVERDAEPSVAEADPRTDGNDTPSNGNEDEVSVVRKFFQALQNSDGAAATAFVVPEMRSTDESSLRELFAGTGAQSLKLVDAHEVDQGAVEANYDYMAGSKLCRGSAMVFIVVRDEKALIERIKKQKGEGEENNC